MHDTPTRPPTASAPRPARGGQAVAALPAHSRLGSFEVQRVIGRGVGTVVYLATDHTLGIAVALQEYLPGRWVRRDAQGRLGALDPSCEEPIARGLRAFIDEARMLARCDHPSLVRVSHLFEANGTAYRVMPYCEGRRVLDLRREMGTAADEDSLRALLEGVLGALAALHRSDHVHGGVSPSKILLLSDDRPLLLGPGAAGRAVAHDPLEPPMPGAQAALFGPPAAQTEAHPVGAWIDLYALAQVLQFCITGELPAPPGAAPGRRESVVEAIERVFAPALRPVYSAAFIGAIEAALSPSAAERPASVAQFREWLQRDTPRPERPAAAPIAPAKQAAVAEPAALARPAPVAAAPVAAMPADPPIAPAPTRPPLPAAAAPSAASRPSAARPRPTDPPSVLDTMDPLLTDRAPRRPTAAAKRRRGAALFAGALVLVGAAALALTMSDWHWPPVTSLDRLSQAARPEPAAPAPAPAPPVSATPLEPVVATTPIPPLPAAVSTPAAPAAPASATATPPEAVAVAALTTVPAALAPSPNAVKPAPQTKATPDPVRRLIAKAPPAAGPRPALPKAARGAPSVAAATPKVSLDNPRAACATRTEFALYRCMQTQCNSPKWSGHLQCARLRATDRVD